MLRWLVVGGGPVGIQVAAGLCVHGKVPPTALRILDPEPSLMDAWRRRAAAVGMTHLRSPSVHNVDVDAWSLQRHAEGWVAPDGQPAFAPPYSRPSTALFDAHSHAVVERLGLDALHVQARATRLEPGTDRGWRVHHADGGATQAERVVLALGPGRARVPGWAARHRAERWLQHVFDRGFDLDTCGWARRVAVIGGGISAAQLAIRLAAAGRRVFLVTPHKLRRAQFDSSPQWLGPAKMAGFSREQSLQTRRRMIDRARRPGTLTKDVARSLRAHVKTGAVSVVHGKVRGLISLPSGVVLGLREPVEVDAIALATGFEGLPGAELTEGLCEDRFPRAPCGTPAVDTSLEWAEGLHVAGALAELQLGPVARNIAGGRRAAERLVAVAKRPAAPPKPPAVTDCCPDAIGVNARRDALGRSSLPSDPRPRLR